MTCVVGLQHKGQVWLGGDSAANSGNGSTATPVPKVWTQDGYVLGFAASFRAGQLLRHYAKLPQVPRIGGHKLDAFMVTEFVPAVREAWIEHGVSAEQGEIPGWPTLVGVQGTLFHLDLDFRVHRSRTGYMAIGCGSDLALGSMHATGQHEPLQSCPRYRIEGALKAAGEHSAGVRPPYTVVAL